MSSRNQEQPKHIVICGAGVIGASIAYYLSLRGARVTIVEEGEVAGAASGYAGGFLAYDWCDHTALQQLARTSFDLHAELAKELGHLYDYRRMMTYSVSRYSNADKPSSTIPWLNNEYQSNGLLGDKTTTAQVHPKKFTETLVAEAVAKEARLVKGKVESIVSKKGKVHAVQVEGSPMECDAAVVAMGPWSSQTLLGLPLPKVYGLKGHSVVIKSNKPLPAHALFIDDPVLDGPELVTRPDGEVYLSGISEQLEVPPSASEVTARKDAIIGLSSLARSLSSNFNDNKISPARACFRPVYRDGAPKIGPVPQIKGAYLACGHSCWGILNAPGTGLALSELILDHASKVVDLSPFKPQSVF